MTEGAPRPMPDSLAEAKKVEEARQAVDPLARQREAWASQKRAQRARRASGGASPAGASPASVAPPDPRVLERVTRMLARMERVGGKLLSAGIGGTIEKGYPGFPLGKADVEALDEASTLYVEVRSQHLLEWILLHPAVAAWLPELFLGGVCLGLMVPRAVATLQARRALKAGATQANGAQAPAPEVPPAEQGA